MTNKINRTQILRNTRQTLDHTLRFFHMVNDQLRNFVENVQTADFNRVSPEEITRICGDFHREHEIRMNELNKVWTDFGPIHNHIPEQIAKIFDPKEIINLNREIIDHTMRFFTTTNEALIKGQVPQHEQILPRTVVETINHAIEDFQKTQIEFTGIFEKAFENVLRTINPTLKHVDEPILPKEENILPHLRIRDEVFALNRDIIENSIRFIMNLNEQVAVLLENVDNNEIEKHAEPIARVRDEFIRNQRIMVERFDTFIHRTAETFSKIKLEGNMLPGVNQIFDHQEVLQINQNAIAGTVKYFTTITEALMQEKHPEQREIVIKATDEFRKHHQILTSRIENIWQEACKKVVEIVDRNKTVVHGTQVASVNHREEKQEVGKTPGIRGKKTTRR